MTDLAFDVVAAEGVRYALVPTLALRLRITADSDERIDSIVLRSQIRVEPERRRYGQAERERLRDVFGESQQWAHTVTPFLWTHVTTSVGAFERATETTLPLECTSDLEVTAGKYFQALDGGEIPLLLLFSGTVFTRGPGGLNAEQINWECEARHRLPVATVQDLFEAYFPDTGWLRLRRETLEALLAYKARHALPTWDDALTGLLRDAGESTRPPLLGHAEVER